jgi:hypothetical protein
MMELRLEREPSGASCTLGELFVGDELECFTLEDVVRDGPKVPGETAIPAGRYQVIITFSNRFQCDMPILLDVPGFTGVRIHPGNTDADTEGCILVGRARHGEALLASRKAYTALYAKIETALDAGDDVWITIANAEPVEAT